MVHFKDRMQLISTIDSFGFAKEKKFQKAVIIQKRLMKSSESLTMEYSFIA